MLQLETLWGPRKRHSLELLTVYVESHRTSIYAEHKVCPLANKCR